MGRRPRIGITPGFADEKIRISKGYVDGIIEAGGLGILLPLTSDGAVLDEAIEMCDGILLSGGPDIDAGYFGEPNYHFNGAIDPVRDQMEIYAARKAVAAGKPVLGICRGIQVLNVALGGSLYQDIYSQVKDKILLRHSQDAPGWYPVHEVNISVDSKLYGIFGKESIGVNSYHHQAVKAPAQGLRPVAWSKDGIIEAVEHVSHAFAIGVQWHPELMWQEDAEVLKLFKAFVDAAG